MKKYNKSEIFSNAWKLVKSTSISISEALKSVWKSVKSTSLVSIEKVAEILGGNIWRKGEIERVYVNRGYNTKKMKTTAYAFILNGNVEVSVFVDCYSQPTSWCIKEAEKVKASILEEIKEVIF